jgi:hypothetical protein
MLRDMCVSLLSCVACLVIHGWMIKYASMHTHIHIHFFDQFVEHTGSFISSFFRSGSAVLGFTFWASLLFALFRIFPTLEPGLVQ